MSSFLFSFYSSDSPFYVFIVHIYLMSIAQGLHCQKRSCSLVIVVHMIIKKRKTLIQSSRAHDVLNRSGETKKA